MDGAKKTALLGLFLSAAVTAFGGPPPTITAQPQDTAVSFGGTANFSVTASSGTTLSYQWYKDGLLNLDTKLTGEISSTLTLSNISLLDPGTFYVEVKNAGGTVTSRHATLSGVLLNSAPVANNNTYTTAEDNALSISAPGILGNDTDVDGNTLTAMLDASVTHGSLSLNSNGSFTYTPNANYNGPDSFTYRVSDGSTMGNVATVNITVTSVSDPCTITSQQITPTGFELRVSGIDSAVCIISASTNLRDWLPISTNTPSAGMLIFTDAAAGNFSSRFYRVETR